MIVRGVTFSTGSLFKRLRSRYAKLRYLKYEWRRRLCDSTPAWAQRLFAPGACYIDMLLLDHGIFRVAYANRHRLGPNAWRSGQPAPHHVDALARQGLRTIVNLRGERFCGSYVLEKISCERHGIKLVDFKIRARTAPTREEIRAVDRLFESVEYPILLHCKSGADRAGLMSVLYRFLREGAPLPEAKRQLSWRYGHCRLSQAGIVDHFFDCYLEYNNRRPIDFLDWVERIYDPAELERGFQERRWGPRNRR